MVPTVLERLPGLPAGSRVLEAIDAIPGVHLVGGAVRDLALGRTPRELDLVVEADGPAVARELSRKLGGTVRVHDTFGTATVDVDDGLSLDVATARAESYPAPGALPVVRAGSLAEDMARRDFTVNAIAVGLSDDVRGDVHAFPGAIADLEAGRLRVLHDASFVDDPTRLLRMARYGTRLGFVLHPRTEQLARLAFASGAPETAGEARMGRELWLLLGEPSVIPALELVSELGGGGPFVVDRERLERVLALLPPDASREHALLAALAAGVPSAELARWLGAAHVVRPGVVLDAARDPEGLATALSRARSASELASAARGRKREVTVVAGALGAQEPARRWLSQLRDVSLSIDGADLLEAGVPQGPEIGRRLGVALGRKLDGLVSSRDEELAAALE